MYLFVWRTYDRCTDRRRFIPSPMAATAARRAQEFVIL